MKFKNRKYIEGNSILRHFYVNLGCPVQWSPLDCVLRFLCEFMQSSPVESSGVHQTLYLCFYMNLCSPVQWSLLDCVLRQFYVNLCSPVHWSPLDCVLRLLYEFMFSSSVESTGLHLKRSPTGLCGGEISIGYSYGPVSVIFQLINLTYKH